MPRLDDLRIRFAATTRAPGASGGADEVLVADSRSKLSPAQMVEQKLRQALYASRQMVGVLAGSRRKKASS
jgi:hypothetical protein